MNSERNDAESKIKNRKDRQVRNDSLRYAITLYHIIGPDSGIRTHIPFGTGT